MSSINSFESAYGGKVLDLWLNDKEKESFGVTFKIKNMLCSKVTPYQRIDVVETESFGKALFLDGAVMFTERDEFIYHEMLVHVPLFTHPTPKKVMVVGGGDGGVVREILKHSLVEEVDLIEIDREVINTCMTYFPNITSSLNDSKVRIKIKDGVKYVNEKKDAWYDIIIVDSTDPIGPGKALFQESFYKDCFDRLLEEGILVAQIESPITNLNVVVEIRTILENIFPITQLYFAPIPTYPGCLWAFVFCSKVFEPGYKKRVLSLPTRYFNFDVYKASFAVPNFVI